MRNTSTATTSRAFFVALLIDGGFVSSRLVNGLGVGETAQVSLHWSARAASTSTVVVDYTGVVAEGDEDNNRLSIGLPEVLFGDLTVTDIETLPANVQDGQQATFVATVENTGAGDVTGDFGVRFEVVGVQILGETTLLGGVLSASTTQVVSPPWTAGPGTFTVKATADSGQVIVESNESNNTLSTSTPAIPSADLVVSQITQFPNPKDGQQVTLTATVENVGAGGTARDFVVGFEVDGVSVGSSPVVGGLPVGASTTVSAEWTAEPGNSTAKAIADLNQQVTESNEANNELVQALAPVLFSDLQITAITRDEPAIGDGQLVTFTARVENTGSGGTVRSFHVRLRINGQSIGDALVEGGLASGSFAEVSKTWTATPGDHEVSAVADQFNTVEELSEANNTLAEQLPTVASSDLVVSDIGISPAGVRDGEAATITATVTNSGNGDVGRSFFVRFEIDGVFIGRQQVTGGITAGQSVQVSQAWTTEAGAHSATVKADELDEVFKSNETNNSATQALPGVPFPDLTVTAVQWEPTTLSDGQAVTLTATVSNVGAGDTARPFAVRFEIDAVSIGTKVVSGGVASGGAGGGGPSTSSRRGPPGRGTTSWA